MRSKQKRVARRAGILTPARGELVQALLRGLALLNRLADSPRGLTVSEAAQEVGLSPSTAHRLLTTLQQERFVLFDLHSRLWRIGLQSFVVGSAFLQARDFLEIARPHMRALMEDTGETVNLAIADEGEAVILSQVECRHLMRALASPGARVPMHCSGVGKALLATMSERDIARILQKQGLRRLTPMTLTSLARLRASLAEILQRGYAVDDQEHSIGLRCVAAVIRDENGACAGAVSLSGPAVRIPDERIPALGLRVQKAAAAISSAYGGNP